MIHPASDMLSLEGWWDTRENVGQTDEYAD